ncbi:MGMT family protein [Enemella sp. A6]|uniref:MGMT family protein n=1 Tax=Enemella sp. A6 TaxID=3440152 RepID=UPI003EBD2673
MDEQTVERALVAVEAIPPGRVISYGDLAGLVGITARQAGAIMRRHGHGLPWWRVTNSYGDLPRHLTTDAAPHWAEEGIAWKPNERGCRIAAYRADLVELARIVDRWQPPPDDDESGKILGEHATD